MSSSTSSRSAVALAMSLVLALSCVLTPTAFSLGGGASAGTCRTRFSHLAVTNDDHDRRSENYPGLDWAAFQKKNASRKKFGLSEMSPEEFLDHQAQVQQLELLQEQKASAMSTASTAELRNDRQQGFFQKLFADAMPDTCESNFDCEQPQHCCDFGLQKICCNSGRRSREGELAYVPIPVETYTPGRANF